MTDDRLFPATVMPDRDWWYTLWPDPEAVLRTIGIASGMEVVDLCCGDGHFTKPMCRLVHPGKTWALDLDAKLLAEAAQACQDWPGFVPVRADARELRRYVSGRVDFVFIANTFHGVPDKTALSTAVYAALKPGGRFAIINWHRLPREETPVLGQPRGPDTSLRMEPDEVRSQVESAGFRLEKVVDVGPYHYGAVFLKPIETWRVGEAQLSTCDKNGAMQSRREQIQALYTELAETPDKDFGWGKGKENARSLGYADEWLRTMPDVVWESAAAVGNPFSVSPIQKGQTVIDLGCGAGADACVAALLVGAEGRVTGIDCTPAMVGKARRNAAASGFANLEFYEADMTSLPVADMSADIVISNGAINLSADKERVLAEAYRILRPGGRLQIADMVKDPSVGEGACCSGDESWADCVSGTLDPETFMGLMEQAGFSNVRLIAYTGYRTARQTVGALFFGKKAGKTAEA
jgi:arsenite methyltransferase